MVLPGGAAPLHLRRLTLPVCLPWLAAVTDQQCLAECSTKAGCVTPSNKAPGGLAPADTPQFIVL